MGKAEIRVVHVPRWVTVLLWMIVSGAMIATVALLSGRAYARETSLSGIVATVGRYRGGSATLSNVLAAISPAAADILFFVPWGALAFLSLDSANRSRKLTYLATVLLGAAFALGVVWWQSMLPSRVTKPVDVAGNVAGCVIGAVLAHARKRVRFRFELEP